MKTKELEELAGKIRMATIESMASIGFGHIGGAMSICDILAVLYGSVLKYDSHNPDWEERDQLILSKGHCGPALYATLALSGFFPLEELRTLNRLGTRLPSHCDRQKTPGIDMTTGSLGQGMSTAAGIALGNRLKGIDSYTYVIVGDGECQEGQVWEGIMFAAQQKLSHFIMLIDFNQQQLDGATADICDLSNLDERLRAFGFYTQKVNGHDVEALYQGLQKAKAQAEKPSAIIALTKKGHGCSFAESTPFNHYMNITPALAAEAQTTIIHRHREKYPAEEVLICPLT